MADMTPLSISLQWIVSPATRKPSEPPGPGGGSLLATADIIVLHHDGNNNDTDDFGAIPVEALLLRAAGFQSKTHLFFGNNLDEANVASQLTDLRASANFAQGLGITIHDYQANVTGTTAALVALFNSGLKVVVLEGGPMEATWRALSAAEAAKRANITCVSHALWNNTRNVSGNAHTWDDLKVDFPRVTYVDIANQNDNGFNGPGWSWMDGHSDVTIQQARLLMNNADNPNDNSDGGMTFYGLTGRQNGTPTDVKNFVEPKLPFTAATVPSAPAAPTVRATGQSSISVSWTAPANGGATITSYDLRYSTASDMTGATTVTGVTSPRSISGLSASTLYYVQVRARNSVGAGSFSANGSATTLAVGGSGSLTYGFNPTTNHGTTGDFFVDAVSGSDANSGTTSGSAKKTIAAAMALAASGDVIKVRGNNVTYREVVVPKAGVTIEGYGTEKPIITAGEFLAGSGWTQCSAADAAVLGPVLGVNGSPVYKFVGLPKSALPNPDGAALNLHEDSIPLPLCVYWPGGDLDDPFQFSNNADWYNADSVSVDANKLIQSYTHAATVAAFTVSELTSGIFWGYEFHNRNFQTRIASVSGSTMTLQDKSHEYNGGKRFQNTFMIQNLLKTLQTGTYGYVDHSTTLDIYVYPNNAANPAAGKISYTARAWCVSGASQDVTLRGLQMIHPAGLGPDGSSGGNFVRKSSSAFTSRLTIDNCKMTGAAPAGSTGYAGIYLSHVNDTVIRNCTIQYVRGTYGIFIQGDGYARANGAAPESSILNDGLLITGCYFYNFSKTAIRLFVTKNAVIARNKMYRTGFDAHGNKTNCYLQCHSILYFGNIFYECDGYITWQEASAIAYLFNYVEPTRGDEQANTARCIVDQNASFKTPAAWTTPQTGATDPFIIANNTCRGGQWAVGSADNGIQVTKTSSLHNPVNFKIHNNIANGYVYQDPAQVIANSGNWNANTGQTAGAGNFSIAPTYLWTDPVNGDYTIPAASAVRSAVGTDLRSIIAALDAKFGNRFNDWYRDAKGDVYDPASPPAGCFVDYDYSGVQTTIAW